MRMLQPGTGQIWKLILPSSIRTRTPDQHLAEHLITGLLKFPSQLGMHEDLTIFVEADWCLADVVGDFLDKG